MAVFVEKIRPAFANPDEEKLFIKDDSHGFPEGTIGKRVVAFFEKSGVTSTRVGHTHLRKYISTQTYELGDAAEGETVEKVMSHGAVTKRRCYVRTDCTRTASKAMQVIARVTSDPNPKSPSGIAETTSQPGSSIQIPLVDCLSPKVPLSERQKLVITEVFAKELATNKPLSTTEVRNKMTLHQALRPIAADSSSVKKVSNYIAYQQRKNPSQSHPPSSIASMQSRVGNWVSALDETASTHSGWSSADSATISSYLEQFKTCPNKETITDLFNDYQDLQDIMRREGFSRCYEKVKNLMKKKKIQ